ncbi:Phosphatidylserine synthase [Komagataella phaffii CBS 7435]|uniref:CDP-diacylglycerol--serine O-phosphatidyltransferase n=2 Tax=Komagataella phaffii TaxID=460519 RepID=C4QX25_KOMPG|nr:Phosphatidylserine synthase, functions in phospholipid biosynthesis [Komagataella phaffii GS115]AOA61258.1 GQ67_02227T0 [Komagataella phaffii]CAH2446597.1 Phosphatidylserine synthase [Komagataella phaffii CBS 7435]AOA65409.1 GQ68_02241T0 [Komagataella phaffii GS115]CAY67798.1 Phosphatidylserine synthase, functions in phospholipid biosynthesis [Komagataella phaffii GS115]CCA36882.1 Phosphatidylserine synthase [Komagataella phaffii CBS 7435]
MASKRTSVRGESDSNNYALSDSSDFEDNGHPRLSKRRSSLFSLSSLSSAEPLPPPDEKDFIAFTSDDRHFSLLRNLHMADFITLMNGFSGFYSIVSCLRFTLTKQTHYVQRAHFFIILGLFFDFFDGKVARLRNKASLIGQELDSLADLISFGVAPASIAFSLGLQTTLDVLCLTFLVLCGLTRLARFNVTVANIPKDIKGKAHYFEGLPIPSTLWLVFSMAFCVYKGWYEYEDGLPGPLLWKGKFFEFHLISLFFVIQGCLMTSKSLKIPKP